MSKEENTLLVSVEDLINHSIGNAGQNCGYVDFKGIQTILHLLARQTRMLEQKVEIQVDDFESEKTQVNESAHEKISSTATVKEKHTQKAKTGATSVKKAEKDAKKANKQRKKDTSRDKAKSTKSKSGSVISGKTSHTSVTTESEIEASSSEEETGTSHKGKSYKESKLPSKGKLTKDTAKTKEKSIAVTEKTSKDDKILVVERKNSTSVVRAASSGIEVVTRSQFDLLADAVRRLQAMAGPAPPPTLPENKQLRKDVQDGKATLADTMNAMNVNARVEAAESAIERLSSLVTQLTQATGGVPGDDQKTSDDIHRLYPVEATPPTSSTPTPAPAERPDALATRPDALATRPDALATRPDALVTRPGAPATIPAGGQRYVTYEEMELQFQHTRDQLIKALVNASQRSTTTADHAYVTARSIGEKMDIAVHLDHRINSLFSKVSDYAQQLKGFDSGIGLQLLSFQDQMTQMSDDLRAGLDIMERTHHNAESAAIVELTERYENLVTDLERTVGDHHQLSSNLEQMGIEIKSLVEWVEMLRDLKADRDEVLDALKDKADLSRLAGLLSEDTFADMKLDLDHRLQLCYDKFSEQEEVWLKALCELSAENATKAESIHLHLVREDAQRDLQTLRDLADRLDQQLGEPKAAILLRQICKDAVCAACSHPALMNSGGDHGGGALLPALPALPALPTLPAAPGAPGPGGASPDRVPLVGHRCNRYVGGSHTLLLGARRARPRPQHMPAHARNYYAYGEDGMLYHLEETCEPCIECNPPPTERDRGTPWVAAGNQCNPITSVNITVDEATDK